MITDENRYNILVSGCGGDIGQSVGKILKNFKLIRKLHGLDISDKNPSQFIYPNFSISLPVTHKEFFLHIIQYIRENNINIYLPIAEPELRYLSSEKLFNFGDVKVVIANQQSLEVGFDKLKTIEFLRDNSFNFPFTVEAKNKFLVKNLPVILKNRFGSGSKTLYLMNNQKQLEVIDQLISIEDFIIQEYLPEIDGEFTCGLFRSSIGEIRTIVLKRTLSGGFSAYGEMVENHKIESLLFNLAIKLQLVGSINVQLRLKDGEPFIFEINPRFSSTVYFRHLFGFKDLEWSIEDSLGLDISEFKRNKKEKFFYKGFKEFIK